MDSIFIIIILFAIAIMLLFRNSFKTHLANDPLEQYKKKKHTRIPLKVAITPTPSATIQEYKTILESKFPYFNSLSVEQQHEFLIRLNAFIKTHKFVPSEMPAVTIEMVVMISATAIQLTFGLSDFLARHIKGFRIYPDVYFSELMQGHLKGHYAPQGIIFLSYKHFEEGYSNAHDGENLGLHEMAHALHFTYAKNIDYDLFFNSLIKDWFQQASDGKHIDMSDDGSAFLRKYSTTNIQEFFAVCVENFFERPQEFYNRLPQVYKSLSFILNQNPLHIDLIAKEEPIVTNSTPILFAEHVSLVPTLVLVSVATCVYGILFFINTPLTISLGLGTIPCLLIKLFSMQKVIFFDNCIVIKNMVWRNRSKTFANQNLLYIAAYTAGSGRSRHNVLSFVYYNNTLKETCDIIEPNKNFLQQIESYCTQRNIMFINKFKTDNSYFLGRKVE